MQSGKKMDVCGKFAVIGLVAGGLLVGPSAFGQQPAQVPNAPSALPDGPRPQTLPNVNSITPLSPPLPATPAADSQAARQTVDDAAPSALPAAPQAQTPSDPEAGAPPIIPAPGEGANTTYKLSVDVRLVQVPFTVKDSKNHLVPGLTPRDIRVYEDGLRQHISVFTTDPFPLSVALVIDQSVTFDTMEKINHSLGALQGAFTPYDEIAIFTYNNGVTKQTDFTAAQSARLGVILERSKGQGRDPQMGLDGPLSQGLIKNNQPIDPNTSGGHNNGSLSFITPKEYHTLNDAILAAAQSTVRANKNRRRIVYVISDGKEYGSKATEKQVIKYLQTNQIGVYATLVGDASVPGLGFLDRIHLPLTMRDDVLPRYAAATGGQVDPEFRPRGIENSFAKITDEVRNQYTVSFYTKQPRYSEKFRTLEVRVLRPSLTVVAPGGYYPAATAPSAPVASIPTATP